LRKEKIKIKNKIKTKENKIKHTKIKNYSKNTVKL
jgi:hypothetical protein